MKLEKIDKYWRRQPCGWQAQCHCLSSIKVVAIEWHRDYLHHEALGRSQLATLGASACTWRRSRKEQPLCPSITFTFELSTVARHCQGAVLNIGLPRYMMLCWVERRGPDKLIFGVARRIGPVCCLHVIMELHEGLLASSLRKRRVPLQHSAMLGLKLR